MENLYQVQDSLCVAQRSKDNAEERVILFVKLHDGIKFDSSLVKMIQVKIRQLLSARHVPAVILETKDIPVSYFVFV